MAIFVLLAGALTCAFFFRALAQFHTSFNRPKGSRNSSLGGGLQVSRSASRRTQAMNEKILRIVRRAAVRGRAKQPAGLTNAPNGFPSVESFIPIGFVLTPMAKGNGSRHRGHPSKRIA